MPHDSISAAAIEMTEQQLRAADEIIRRALPSDMRALQPATIAGVVVALAINQASLTRPQEATQAVFQK